MTLTSEMGEPSHPVEPNQPDLIFGSSGNPEHTFLRVELSPHASLVEALSVLSRFEIAPGIHAISRHRNQVEFAEVENLEGGATIYRQPYDVRYATYSVDQRLTTAELRYLASRYAEATHSSIPLHRLQPINCECDTDTGQCNEFALRHEKITFRYDYTTVLSRLQHAHPDIFEREDTQESQLLKIVDTIMQIDPEGKTNFDVRLNRRSAIEYGCVEVLQDQVRDAPYGAEHTPEEELKTLCFVATPTKGEKREPLIVMINTMASEKVAMSAVKKCLQANKWGKKFDLRPADITRDFKIAKGEVHPLSLTPRRGDPNGEEVAKMPVVHIYDSKLQQPRAVTTNGGHPDWTTEFQSDEFIECMLDRYNTQDGEPQLVLVADIAQAQESDDKSPEAIPSQSRQWNLEEIELVDGEIHPPDRGTQKRAMLIATEKTTLFSELLQRDMSDSDLFEDKCIEEPPKTALHVLRQPSLDYEVVKFPQNWRPMYEQLGIALATAVKAGVDTLFLDCNITPLEDLLRNSLPDEVRALTIATLRDHLEDHLNDIPDDKLIGEIAKSIFFVPKPVVLTEHLRRRAIAQEVSNVFLVGGSQVADPGISKYHYGLMSIDHLINIHVLDSEQMRSARLAMYFAETDNSLQQYRDVAQLYEIIRPMLGALTDSHNPLLVLASTSICESFHRRNSVLIPDEAVPFLADFLGVSTNAVRRDQQVINAIPVLNSSTVYARAAAELMAHDIGDYGQQYL